MPDYQSRLRIAAEGLLDQQTVRRAYEEPHRMRPGPWTRVYRAAVALGIQPPTQPERFFVSRRGPAKKAVTP